MKKTGLLLGLLALVACEQQELEYVENNVANIDIEAPTVQTRAETSSISGFDPLSELRGIPLNIISVENTKNKYLSAKISDNDVVLYNRDDGSGRQRWYYEAGLIVLRKGNDRCGQGTRMTLMGTPVLGAIGGGIPKDPILVNTTAAILPSVPTLVPVNDQEYVLDWLSYQYPNLRHFYIEPKSTKSDELTIRERNSGVYEDYYHWTVAPVGTFRLVKMEYEKSAEYNDYVYAQPRLCKSYVFNDSPILTEQTLEVSGEITENSSFSEAYGISTQTQSGSNWNFTVPLVSIGFGGNVSSTTTSSENVSFSESTTNHVKITETFKATIPPHTPCRIEILKMTYSGGLTYVATLEKTDGDEKGKQFRIKGRWSGVVCSDLYYNVYDLSNNLRETTVIPEGATSIAIQSFVK